MKILERRVSAKQIPWVARGDHGVTHAFERPKLPLAFIRMWEMFTTMGLHIQSIDYGFSSPKTSFYLCKYGCQYFFSSDAHRTPLIVIAYYQHLLAGKCELYVIKTMTSTI